jgi:septum formation protein
MHSIDPTTRDMPPDLILASSSPYRRLLLERLRLPFACVTPDIDEAPVPGEAPAATAMRLAQKKASIVARDRPQAVVIGSDQVATLDGLQIGKPGSHANALRQLQAMRGRQVIFHTALCLIDGRSGSTTPIQSACVPTIVTFRDLPDAALDAYLLLDTPYDCAGSAKNESLGIALLERCESDDPTALTGLPLIALCGMLHRAGIALFGNAAPRFPDADPDFDSDPDCSP